MIVPQIRVQALSCDDIIFNLVMPDLCAGW
jgi:hypothetical protein